MYHLNRRSISLAKGKTRRGAAAAMSRYILRADACSAWTGELPAWVDPSPRAVFRWLSEVGERSRKNGRLGDRIIVAIPRELRRREDRVDLLARFGHRLSEGKVPWFAGLHDQKKDQENPHAHLFIRDHELREGPGEEGPSVLGLSQLGTTLMIRLLWQDVTNAKLRELGLFEKVDARSHRARGIARTPQTRRRAA